MNADERNALARERRRTDPQFREAQNRNKLRYRERQKARLVDGSAPQKPKAEDPIDRWFRDSILLNSDDLEQAEVAKRSCRHRMDVVLAMALKASNAAEPKKEQVKEESEEGNCGLADDY
jgi:hypothetical protein